MKYNFFLVLFFLFRNSLIKMNVICVIIKYFEIVEKEQKKPLEQLYKVSYKCFLVRYNLNTFLMNLNFLNLYPL